MKKFHPVITNFLFNLPSYSSLNRVWIFSTPNQACFLIKKLKNLHSIYIQNCMPHFTIFQVWMFLYSCSNTSSVIRQKVESQNGGDKKTKHTKYLKKQTHLTPWYAHIPVGKKCFFFRKFCVFCFLMTSFEKFPLPYYQLLALQNMIWLQKRSEFSYL